MEDTQIVARLFDRDETALSDLRGRYGAYLTAVAGRILNDRADCDEVVQDTLVAAWRNIPPEKPARLRAYLARIARNLALKRLEYLSADKRGKNAAEALSELTECLPDRSTLDDAMEARQIKRIIERVLDRLPPLDRALFVRRYYEVRSLSETAALCRVTERKARYRLSLVRAALKTELEKEEIDL